MKDLFQLFQNIDLIILSRNLHAFSDDSGKDWPPPLARDHAPPGLHACPAVLPVTRHGFIIPALMTQDSEDLVP